MHLSVAFLLAVSCHFFGPLLAQSRQFGGYDATVAEFPYVVAIVHGTTLKGNGAIVATRWILSTANVFLKHPLSEYAAHAGGDTVESGEKYPSERIYQHQGWFGFIDNIALMKLNRDLTFGATIKPIVIPESDPNHVPEVFMLSYGKNEQGTSHLRSSQYFLTADPNCVGDLKDEKNQFVIEKKFGYCVYPSGGSLPKGQSYDDAGAPLVFNDQLIALYALRDDEVATDFNNVSVATRVAPYRDWIERTMTS